MREEQDADQSEEAVAPVPDKISLHGLVFQGHHGMYSWEQRVAQPFEVDVELHLDLRPAGTADDPSRTVDYCRVYRAVQQEVETARHGLLEALAEAIAARVLDLGPVEAVTVRVRKPRAALPGPSGSVQVEIHRRHG